MIAFLEYMGYHKIQIPKIISLFFRMDIIKMINVVKNVIIYMQIYHLNGVDFVRVAEINKLMILFKKRLITLDLYRIISLLMLKK